MKVSQELVALCDDIFEITGIHTVLYSADGKHLYSHPGTMSDFCAEVRKSEKLTKKCFACDQAGFEQCRRTGDICIYRCHMGLYETVAPIIDGGIVVGYLMFGQLLPSGTRDEVERIIHSICDSDFGEKLRWALPALTETNESTIRAAARVMAMCACYIRLNHLLGVQKESLALYIEEYVERHLHDPALSMESVCRAVGISRSSLYNVCRRAFSMGISDYIRARRLERAVELIKTTELPVYRIAEEVGFSDSDYLIKRVRLKTGKTPGQLRKATRE